MCEIAVLDPERVDISLIHQVAYKFHEEQGDGIGILAVKESPEGFSYDAYKSTEPHWQTAYSFLRRNYGEAWRFVVHGRYQTAGSVNKDNCHPIAVDCDECEFDYVVHNGSVRQHANKRAEYLNEGHDFNTHVDSEVIAHAVGSLPDSVESKTRSSYPVYGKLNYLLFSENGILVRVFRKYELAEDFTLTCSRAKFDDPDGLGFALGSPIEWMLIEPGEDGPEIETKERTTTRTSSSTGTNTHSPYRSNGASNYDEDDPADWEVPLDGGGTATDESVTLSYTDHCAEFDHIAAIKVAPGVMRVIEKREDKHEFVFRDKRPELYYWYAPEETPEDVDSLEEYVETRTADGEQESLDDFSDEEVLETIAEETMNSVQRNLPQELTLEEVADVEDTILQAMNETADAVQGTIGG